jgi:Flp pilus assembly protein TadG
MSAWRLRWALTRSRKTIAAGPDAGGLSLELVILTPLLLALVLLIIGFGRVEHARQEVTGAAGAAARAATLTRSPGQAAAAARSQADTSLADAGVSCSSHSVSVNTAGFGPGGQVSVRVSCTASLSDLVIAGFPGHYTLHGQATSPIGRYRAVNTASGGGQQ